MLGNNHILAIQRSLHASVFKIQRRWKNKKDHWSSIAKGKSTDKALEYFDDFYKQVFNRKWASIRLGLLSENKYCAVVNNYSDTERVEAELESLGAINVKKLLVAQLSLGKFKSWKVKLDNIRSLENGSSIQEDLKESDPNDSPSINLEVDKQGSDHSISSRLVIPFGKVGSEDALALHDFMPATKLKGMEDFVPESQHYSYYKNSLGESEFSAQIETEDRLDFPDTLRVYSFDTGNISRFPQPRRGSTGVSDYYLLDGSSLLPVLCLGLNPGDKVLDMCSAPGGKSLMCLQTLLVDKLVSNDISLSRVKRLKRVFNEFFYDLPKMEESEEVVITNDDGRHISCPQQYNKILVDVPCTTDRYSVKEDDNNIFRPDRIKERIKLPELQTELLVSALQQVQDGGTVVYSTCSLSPVQNDGVVHMALKRVWEDTSDNIIVKDLSRVLVPYKTLYKFADIDLKYGHLIIPYLPSNFGPMYFCKLVKRNNC